MSMMGSQVAGQSGVPTQVPLWHASGFVHPLPSLQAVPSGRLGGAPQLPVPGSHAALSWHASAPPQVFSVPAVQVPPWQVSAVHLLPSASQLVPSDLAGGGPQLPVPGSHAALSWHASAPPHALVGPVVHVPPWHVSAVHRLPFSQAVPSDFAGFVQLPELGSQAPATWH
jgi:hypothetical protein